MEAFVLKDVCILKLVRFNVDSLTVEELLTVHFYLTVLLAVTLSFSFLPCSHLNSSTLFLVLDKVSFTLTSLNGKNDESNLDNSFVFLCTTRLFGGGSSR